MKRGAFYWQRPVRSRCFSVVGRGLHLPGACGKRRAALRPLSMADRFYRRRPDGVYVLAHRGPLARLAPATAAARAFAPRALAVLVAMLLFGVVALGGFVALLVAAGFVQNAALDPLLVAGTVLYALGVTAGYFVIACGGFGAIWALWREWRARRAEARLAAARPPPDDAA